MKQVILYALSGADMCYRVLRYFFIDEEFISIDNIRYCAAMLAERYPGVRSVYAIDNRSRLYHDYRESLRNDNMESWFEFRDILELDGLKII